MWPESERAVFLARRSRLAYEDQPSEMAQDFRVGKRAKDAVVWKGVASSSAENSQLKANDRCSGRITCARY